MKTIPWTARPAVALLTGLLAACGADDNVPRVVGELASDRIELTAESSEPIVEILVAEGEPVAVNQLLVRQDPLRATANLQEAMAMAAEARARLDELVRGPRAEQIAAARAGVEGAERDLAFRRSEHERIRTLREQGLASPDQHDRARAALDAADANLDLQRARLEELLAGTTVEELTQAEQVVRRTEARVDAARLSLERHDIRAPVDGIVDSRLFEVGERPQPGKPLLILLPGSQPFARVYVPEYLRVHLNPGSAALVYVDGLVEPVAGRVRWVASEAAFTPYYALTERDRGRLSFVAKVDITGERPRLPDGVPVEVEFPDETP